ncbi:DNA repair protein RadC [Shewanella sp. SR43-4]|jgi:DNA repair protein RadC|uniref:DNA repair protein RadC n=1 Tax=Shewanella vesiculosa TaxID=518738 RepID=A0ABV0FTB2_9GAMM|nr:MULTISPECIES: DNA repair protein RadC [Shewanella]NCQ46867.1 JAB domain-containing protein [Shewanella frigidimarina]MBB1319609.1 DNA repair protein RadC [Shewanella sp. SR43-4]MBB1389228.1 DNA repair protein RadC [Shewanella sp. SG44-6]MBB1476789.1 DNA repair protein RadC [Shewanella sp. SG41-3]NCO73152.1 JAB domain-containing protein [Shewanella vesiculosa]|tara:strand:- start:887 stop:1564 length:678 start_codon:yes stop_codon:yes gene_type:complete
MGIKDWPQGEGPREKLLLKGAGHLSDAELLAVILRNGLAGQNAVDLARNMIHQFGGLRSLLSAPKSQVCKLAGVGPVKYAQLQAAAEISKRIAHENLQRGQILTNPDLTRDYLMRQLADRSYEVFALLLLDTQHRVIQFVELFRGTIDSASVYPREVVSLVLEKKAAAVIVCHNHPSGIAEPSQADRRITERIKNALATIDVSLLDHMVVGDQEIVSFAERGWIV